MSPVPAKSPSVLRRLAWPTAAALAGLAVLVSLGVWQVQRLSWKTGLIASIEEGLAADPLPLSDIEAGIEHGYAVEWLKTQATGAYRHDLERHLYTVADGVAGYRVLTPLVTGAGLTVWVDRGFVPEGRKDAGTRREGQVAGEQSVTGLVRAPEGQGPFTPDNEADRNVWFWPDLAAMTATADPPLPGGVLPAYIEMTGPPPPGGYPRPPQRARIDLPNNHLGYAITWFGLAATLIGVYIAFALKTARNTP